MLDSLAIRFQKYAPLILRFGLAVVFVLFGLQKLTNPSQTTAEIQLLLSFDLADAAALNYYLGLTEMLIASALIIGLRVRWFSLLGSFLTIMFLLSFFVKYGTSINPDLYRDVGLTAGSLALFLLGAGPLSLDQKIAARASKSKKGNDHTKEKEQGGQ